MIDLFSPDTSLIWLAALFVFGGVGLAIGVRMTRSTTMEKALRAEAGLQGRISELEAALRESEERYYALFHQPAFPICILDADSGKFTAFNTCLHELHGYTREELEKLTFADIELNATADERLKRRKRIVEEGSVIFETRHKTKNGEIIDLLVSSVGVKIGGRQLIQNIGVDISKRKLAEEVLSKSEKRFRQLIEYIPDALFLHDMEGKILNVNQSACESLGYMREELLGLHIQDIDEKFIPEKDLPKFVGMHPGVPVTLEGMQKCKDGSTFPAEIRLLVIESDHRQILALVRNIAKRKYAEEERKKLEAQLAYAQKMQAVGTLAGGIAHNFNNLLMGIQGNVSLMLFDKALGDPDHKKLDNIEKLVENGAKLTRQLLGYAREGKYEPRPLSLNRLVKETSETFGSTRKEISIHYDLDDGLSGIRGDQGQIEQTLLNLFINAGEAMPNGGELYIKTENTSHEAMNPETYTPEPGDYVRLIIKDTGIGIDEETMGRIFDPFFTTKSLAKGSGLGLASVYGIIKSHGGYIEVDSRKGKGTAFHIYLPAVKRVEGEKKKQKGDIIMGNETVLLVDDEDLVMEAGELMLKSLGYDVLLAKNGREALDIFEQNRDKIDMVLLDMVMPDMGGGEAYDKMKNVKSDLKVLLSSGYGIDGEAKEIMERGCNGFIQKPFRLKELSEKIREVLE